MEIEIRDDVIWFKQFKNDPVLSKRLEALAENEEIRLTVGGITGSWVRMRTGRDGRPTNGIKPVGAMADVWKRWQVRRGERVGIHLYMEADEYLQESAGLFTEWLSAEDEEAFSDL